MSIVGDFKEKLYDLFGIGAIEQTQLSEILTEIVSEETPFVFLDKNKLQYLMKNKGISESDILKVCLMAGVTGFSDLIINQMENSQQCLDRYVMNAQKETGFNRITVLQLTFDILVSLGVVNVFSDFANVSDLSNIKEKKRAVVIPCSLYLDELRPFQIAFQNISINNREISHSLNFKILEPLLAIDLPKAKYYYGFCLLYGIQIEKNEMLGLKLLKEAAADGDSDASAALGDYFSTTAFEKDLGVAYEYYSGYGAPALDSDRSLTIMAILQKKTWNFKTLTWSLVLLLLNTLLIIISMRIDLYSQYAGLSIFCIVVQTGLLTLEYLYYRKHPYGTVIYFPVIMFGIWILYMVIRMML